MLRGQGWWCACLLGALVAAGCAESSPKASSQGMTSPSTAVMANVPVNVYIGDPQLTTNHAAPGMIPIETVATVHLDAQDNSMGTTIVVEPVVWVGGSNRASTVFDGLSSGKYTGSVKAKTQTVSIPIKTKNVVFQRAVGVLLVYPDGEPDKAWVVTIEINPT